MLVPEFLFILLEPRQNVFWVKPLQELGGQEDTQLEIDLKYYFF